MFSYVNFDYIAIFCSFFLSLAEVGAALFQWVGSHWEFIGIDSSDIDGCPRAGYNALFVRIAAYTKWIESIINLDNPTTSSTQLISTESDTITPMKPSFAYECNRTTKCGCGYSDVIFRQTRIAGGENAIDGSWSMIVSLRFDENEEHSCAGTLLSSSFVLTAAHCVDHFTSTHPINITIDAGITNRFDSNRYQRNVEKIHIHPNYTNSPLFLNNIALLEIDRPVYFQNNPILAKTCVHRTNSSISINDQHPKNGTRLVVIGWGTMRPESFVLSEYLKQIQIYAIDNQDEICKNVISNNELQFCAGLYYGEKGT
jgi:secreted trypsin-like serine protease